MSYHKPSLKRPLYRPTGQQRGGMYYLMVETKAGGTRIFTKWGPRHSRPSAALTSAHKCLARFPRVCVVRQGVTLPVWDSADGLWLG